MRDRAGHSLPHRLIYACWVLQVENQCQVFLSRQVGNVENCYQGVRRLNLQYNLLVA